MNENKKKNCRVLINTDIKLCKINNVLFFRYFCLDAKVTQKSRLILLGDPLTARRLTKLMSRFAQRNSVLTPSSPSGFPACEDGAVFIF
jgi:hypothetical protein